VYTLYYTGLNLFLHYTFIVVCTQIVLNLLAILSFILRQCQLDLSGNLNFFFSEKRQIFVLTKPLKTHVTSYPCLVSIGPVV
jgi:hypothetical protein